MGPDDGNAEKPEEKGWEADMSRKIELMHELFGACVGKKCGQCGHLVETGTHQKKYFKCEVYGDTASEATDWARSWPACMMIGDTGAWMGRNVMELARGDRKKEESPIEGQMDLFDVSEE